MNKNKKKREADKRYKANMTDEKKNKKRENLISDIGII